MDATATAEATSPPTGTARLVIQVIAGLTLSAGFVAGMLWLAGDWAWVAGWSYIGLLTGAQIVASLIIRLIDRELLVRRASVGKGTEGWDKIVLPIFGVAFVATLLVAALDVGRGWAPLPGWLWFVGAAIHGAGVAIVVWAMAFNTHFEKTVRIQHDRNHQVCEGGPYALVRHPGYIGVILAYPLTAPLMLGSAWAFVPAVLATGALILRTALEDRTLRKKLTGYEAYTTRTRYRLLPGIW